METQPASSLPAEPLRVESLQTPSQRVGLGFLALLAVGAVVLQMGLSGIGALLLPSQIVALDPAHKVADLGAISSVGALVALVANLLGGTFSDRTTGRWGRRRPWMLMGALGCVLALWVLLQSHIIVLLGLGFALYQFFANITLAPLAALIPDRVPEQQRGIASGMYGLGIALGIIIAAVLIGSVIKLAQPTYLIMIGVTLVFFVPFSLFLPAQPVPRGSVPAFHLGTFLKGFWVSPRHYPDFWWAFVIRFIPGLGFFIGLSFLFYYLQDAVQYQRVFPGQTALQGTATITVIAEIALAFSIVLGGILSDRVGRRKPFIIASLVGLAIALLLFALLQTWTFAVLGGILLGLSAGVYLAVDLALVTQVLPSAETHGKDLGIMNIASSLPTSLAPAIAGITLSAFHGANPHVAYGVLFVAAALICLVTILAVPQIKGVK